MSTRKTTLVAPTISVSGQLLGSLIASAAPSTASAKSARPYTLKVVAKTFHFAMAISAATTGCSIRNSFARFKWTASR